MKINNVIKSLCSKILNFENKIKDKIADPKVLMVIFIFIVSVLAIVIRITAIKYQGSDYIIYLSKWYEQIKADGGFRALSENIGDYNVPYLVILTILTYIPIPSLISIKIVSIIFDFVCAIFGALFAYEYVKDNKNSKFIATIVYTAILFLPTVVLNSGLWAQCDSIYTSFVLISLYLMKKDKVTLSFIFLGIAFGFKLQCIMILPLYLLLYFRKKNISIFHYILIPLVDFIMCLPAIVAGRGIKECLMIYFNQTGTYDNLVLNYPNLYTIFGEIYKKESIALLIFTAIIIGIICLYLIYKNVKVENNLIKYSLIFSSIMVFFLPRMHERYAYLVDILALIWVITRKKDYYFAIILELSSLVGYFAFIYNNFDYKYLEYFAIANFVAITRFLIKNISENEDIKLLKENNM